MTSSLETLSNVKKYHGNIQIANGSKLPIHAIGDMNPSIKDVLVSPELSISLISVGQLVDNDYDVQFSCDGCVVQDQVLGKILAKGPKVGHLFPLHLFIPNFVSLACKIAAAVLNQKLLPLNNNNAIFKHLEKEGGTEVFIQRSF
ncbi:hypothetical protein ZIOFF_036056 [Zingiber officinale]|uniref:Uncharacterized protein n=1 Tax=Zingiber officinale TaxID=94328 RepID=A0A8J5GPR4_ZINOF|nr:hypothetical protein ZIOFF_036056 [Zingiber officinale]